MDPSGVKVFQDIANSAAEPKAGILATGIGVLIALFGASGIFGQLQDALNTIWTVKPKPSQGIWGFIRARFLSFAMVRRGLFPPSRILNSGKFTKRPA